MLSTLCVRNTVTFFSFVSLNEYKLIKAEEKETDGLHVRYVC